MSLHFILTVLKEVNIVVINNINDPYAKLCVSDVFKNINVRVSNLMSRTNETRHIKWHETCKCKCRLDASVYNTNNVGTMVNADVNVKN